MTKKMTNKVIKSMNFGEKSRLAHSIAKQLEGDYSARLKLAWEYINGKRKNSVKKINNLLSNNEKTTQKTTENTVKKGKKTNNDTFKERMEKRIKQGKPAIVSLSQDTEKDKHEEFNYITESNIRPNVNNDLLETGLVSQKVINTIIEKRLNDGIREDIFYNGILEIEMATTMDELKSAVLLNFSDKDIIKKAYKYISMGMDYKKFDELTDEERQEKYNFNYISPNAGALRVEAIDTLKDVQAKIKEGTKDEKIFMNMANYYTAITFLVSNALRTEIRRKFNPNARITNFSDMVQGDDMTDNQKMDYVIQSAIKDEGVETRLRTSFSMVEKLEEISDYQKTLFKLRLLGYSDKDIDKITGKRNDREYQKMDRVFMDKLGITDKKEYRKMYKSTVRSLADLPLPTMKEVNKIIEDIETVA